MSRPHTPARRAGRHRRRPPRSSCAGVLRRLIQRMSPAPSSSASSCTAKPSPALHVAQSKARRRRRLGTRTPRCCRAKRRRRAALRSPASRSGRGRPTPSKSPLTCSYTASPLRGVPRMAETDVLAAAAPMTARSCSRRACASARGRQERCRA
jgi:hypothetical protein